MTEMQLLALEASDATVVITGLVLVMAMLVVLCLIIMVEGKLFDRGEQLAHRTGAPRVAKATQEAAARAKAAPTPAARAKAAPAPAAAPAAPAAPGVAPEVVAAIAAAVACTESGAVVRSIRRAPAPAGSTPRRGAWGQAGLNAATRPFLS